MVIPFSK